MSSLRLGNNISNLIYLQISKYQGVPKFDVIVEIRVLRGKVFGTPDPICLVISCPDPDRTRKK